MFFRFSLSSAAFWSAFGSIMLANIVLSGDNAVVIAMAARTLQPEQQKKAIFWGSTTAVVSAHSAHHCCNSIAHIAFS